EYSDIVALMVFEHQMHMMNLLTRIGWQTRFLLRNGNAHDIKMNGLGDSAKDLVDYMLFVDEEPLLNKVEGTSGFVEKFSDEGRSEERRVGKECRSGGWQGEGKREEER